MQRAASARRKHGVHRGQTDRSYAAKVMEQKVELRPAVAGFTYVKLTPLLGWPDGLSVLHEWLRELRQGAHSLKAQPHNEH